MVNDWRFKSRNVDIFSHAILWFKTGLFHRAISQSGSGHCPWTLARPGTAKKKATKVAELLSCPSKSSKNLIECLRNKNAIDIIATDREFQVSATILVR